MTSLAQRSFSAGEISPALYSRADTVKYSQGLKTCRNWIVNTNGSVSTRPGTIYCEPFLPEPTAGDSEGIARLIPFYQSETQNYVLIFTEGNIKFLKNGSYIKESEKTISAITNANPGVVTSNAHGYSVGNYVFMSVNGMSEISGKYYKVANTTANTFELRDPYTGNLVDTTSYGAYIPTGGVSRVYSISTSYTAPQLQYIKFAQVGDILTITHVSHPPKDLSYISDTNWSFASCSFGTSATTPTGLTFVSGGDGSPTIAGWVVTAIEDATNDESLPSAILTQFGGNPGSGVQASTISWTAVAGCSTYYIYRYINGLPIFVGFSNTNIYTDSDGANPDFTKQPPRDQDFFDSTDNYPGAIAYHQQRMALGGTNNLPQTVWMSHLSSRLNFLTSSPSDSLDGLQFSVLANARTKLVSFLSADDFFVFTPTSEFLITGDNANILRPTAINSRQISNFGSSILVPSLIVGSSPVFVQASSGKVFELDYLKRSSTSGGLDLTTFSSHLVDKYSIVDWVYQQTPQSIIWSCRSDGVLLGCTYDKDQQILAWHRHDTDGLFQNIVTIPETPVGFVDSSSSWPASAGSFRNSVYFIVQRTVDGQTKRFIEKQAEREINDIVDFIGMDCATNFDLTAGSTGQITLSGGVTWDDGETITATFSLANAYAGLVGSELRFTSEDGTEVRFRIQGFTSSSIVTGMVNRLVPVDLRNTASDYLLAQKTFGGLTQLEGKEVSIFADGYVVASPNNAGYPVYTVTDGEITLDIAATVVTVGLPFTADIKTLDADIPSGETISDKKQLVTRVTMDLVETRGLFVGADEPTGSDPLANLMEMKLSDNIYYDDPIALKTGKGEIQIQGKWDASGSVFVRQVDPLPSTIGSIIPAGQYAFASSRRKT